LGGCRIFQISIDAPGTVSITARPRGGDWLEDDVAGLAQQGVGVVVSLLCADEQVELALEEEAAICSKHDIEFISLPVPDLGVPHDTEEFVAAIYRLVRLVRAGSNIAVHCRQSIGRSGLLAVSIVMALGMTLEPALECVSNARGVRVPETDEQRRWLQRNERRLSELVG
jgi:protein-tyrosine phosphatase